MRSVCSLTLTAALLAPALLFAQSPAEETSAPPASVEEATAPAAPGEIDADSLPAFVGDILRQVSARRDSGRSQRMHERHSRHGRHAQPAANPTSAGNAVASDIEEGPGIVEVPPPAPADDVVEPAAPAAPNVATAPAAPVVAAPFSMRDRLLARRLGRIQQLKQSAAESGDPTRVQQAQYLEGMVLELHEQGLFNFAQKFMSTLQQPETPAGDAPPVELPEADLGAPAALPEIDLGDPEPPPANPPVE